MNIFWRGVSHPMYFLKKYKWKKDLNETNIQRVSKRYVNSVFVGENEEFIDAYKAIILKKYIKNEYDFSFSSVKRIKRVRKKLNLNLSEHEAEYILRLEELAFAHNRPQKSLDTPFELNHGEKCTFRLETGFLYKKSASGKLVKFASGHTYITNQRTVLVDGIKDTTIEYWKFDSVKLKSYGIMFKNENKDTLSRVLRSDDNDIMFVYYTRLFEAKNS